MPVTTNAKAKRFCCVSRKSFVDAVSLAPGRLRFSRYAPEPDMRSGGIYRLPLARRRPVAQAVVRRAQVRAALDHLVRDVRSWLPDRVAPLRGIDPRISRNAAGLRRRVRAARRKIVRGPLPHVARCVVEPVAGRRERLYRRGPLVAVGLEVLPGEPPLPGVSHHLALGGELVPPGVGGALQPPARGELPLRLRGQLFVGPTGVGLCVLVGDLHDRVALPTAQVASRALGVPPAGAWHVSPPVAHVAQVYGTGRLAEDEGAGYEQRRFGLGVVCRFARAFRDCHVPG